MRNYNSSDVKIQWMGLDLTNGLSDGTFVSYQDDGQTWTYIKDGLGGGIRYYNDDSSGELQLTVDVETNTHQLLLFYSNFDRLSKNLSGPLIVNDQSSGEKMVFTNAYIIGEPNESRGTQSVAAIWAFRYSIRRNIPNLLNNNIVGS